MFTCCQFSFLLPNNTIIQAVMQDYTCVLTDRALGILDMFSWPSILC